MKYALVSIAIGQETIRGAMVLAVLLQLIC